ncbi:UNVERIFIED_CONTAM: hypothetical protein Sangu_2450000 [Sesamum angustifolium]|uniref:Uncharacterized protein n=1 Tax=Sesamum angustifolium TaxID=2727405 RepID=A0AAW2KY87_9LAMI
MSSVASNFLTSPRFCGQSGGICPLAPHVQQLQSLKLSLVRVWARLKVLFVGVLPVDLVSVRLDPWDEVLVGPPIRPDLYVLALVLDHHDLRLKGVLLEFLEYESLLCFLLFFGSPDSPITGGKSLFSQQRGVRLIVPLSLFMFFWMDA